MNELEFYAKIEEILGFNDAKEVLYEYFLEIINNLSIAQVKFLDFGCGSGHFAKLISKKFDVIGIDKSLEMVKKSRLNGIDARNCTIKDLSNYSFGVITAVFDVLNYMNKNELNTFLKDCSNILSNGGFLIFDINTWYGFNDIANGLLYEKYGADYLIVDAKFKNEILITNFVLFENTNELFLKHEYYITQYFHNLDMIEQAAKYCGLSCKNKKFIKLYSHDDYDKVIFIFQKESR